PPSLPPLHLRPTLFPYTTLFRSGGTRRDDRVPPRRAVSERHDLAWAGRFTPGRHEVPAAPRHPRPACGRPPAARPWRRDADSPEDRKSTRLNSSHLGISYAVFCL